MAKNLIFTIMALAFFGLNATAQSSTVRDGSTLILGKADANGYDYIAFPRKNFIIKRGAIADYKPLYGMEVVVESQRERNGSTWVTLRRADGGKFFRFIPSVEARLEKALDSGELTRS
ncbi:hypothetical protein [Robiginitalea sp. SC105]|uniref:hypothetical protein n=1 Tax=Robiginitalea sp. SC105 TaxID=2762332 RepID=UPI0016398C8C|nr:hypothetical protein [Robiginitalea sp. SC105]MBC2837931.1 hypothetical protein [Robiginitalea sp. SC105]